jgi:RES domain-containing protein
MPLGCPRRKRRADGIRSGVSALLVVPSVIVPEEVNVLINPLHADSARIVAAKIRKWLYDPRLIKAP